MKYRFMKAVGKPVTMGPDRITIGYVDFVTEVHEPDGGIVASAGVVLDSDLLEQALTKLGSCEQPVYLNDRLVGCSPAIRAVWAASGWVYSSEIVWAALATSQALKSFEDEKKPARRGYYDWRNHNALKEQNVKRTGQDRREVVAALKAGPPYEKPSPEKTDVEVQVQAETTDTDTDAPVEPDRTGRPLEIEVPATGPGIAFVSQQRMFHMPFDSDTIKRVLTIGLVGLSTFGIVSAVAAAVVAAFR